MLTLKVVRFTLERPDVLHGETVYIAVHIPSDGQHYRQCWYITDPPQAINEPSWHQVVAEIHHFIQPLLSKEEKKS